MRATSGACQGDRLESGSDQGSIGRRNKKDGERSADEERWGMSRAELEKRILRLHKGGTGILKIGNTQGIGIGSAAAAPIRRRRR
jgi:hypothetical protein